MILGAALVTRSVRRRRALVAALASGVSGTYGPSATFWGEHDWTSESKPVLWETHITAGSDGEKGWSGLLVRRFSRSLNYYKLHAESVSHVSL